MVRYINRQLGVSCFYQRVPRYVFVWYFLYIDRGYNHLVSEKQKEKRSMEGWRDGGKEGRREGGKEGKRERGKGSYQRDSNLQAN